MALDLVISFEKPVGHHVGAALGPLTRRHEHPRPRVFPRLFHQASLMRLRQIEPHRMVLVAMHPALALFHVNGVPRQVPMHHPVAIKVEIEPLLPDRGRGENERAKWRVEGLPNLIDALGAILATAALDEASGEPAAHPEIGASAVLPVDHDACAAQRIVAQVDLR